MILTLAYFILALLLLVTIHEYGHFLVARLCGVKVLRFSFGFGKVLAHWHDKKGTEYAWSILPLGGYVKMLDENEGAVAAHERHLAFNNKSVWARIAIVLAGPLFNFLFAFVALWLVLVIGIHSLAPIIADVKPNSMAAQAGIDKNQEILQLNDEKITSWRDFQYALMAKIGSNEKITLLVKSLKNGEQKTVILPLANWHLDVEKPDALASLGIVPFIPAIPPIVGDVMPDSPANSAHLQKNDRIEKIDGKAVNDWLDLVEFIKKNPDKKIKLTILRDGKPQDISLTIGSHEVNGKREGYVGMMSQKVDWPKEWLRLQRENPLLAIKTAFLQTAHLTGTTFSLIGRLVTGKLSMQTISGPVGIAQGAGDSGRSGIAYYLSFLALVSISLGVLNLLPVPMLDGGHLLYYVIEIIRRKPLSDEVKSLGMYIGLLLLVTLMTFAVYNDVARLMR